MIYVYRFLIFMTVYVSSSLAIVPLIAAPMVLFFAGWTISQITTMLQDGFFPIKNEDSR